ncbi:MAG: hypothetical protein WAL47_17570 [Pyrinomonadaceae bacterium]
MKRSVKTSLIIVALALLACLAWLAWLGSRPDELDELDGPAAANVSENSRGPSFTVRVIMPRLGLPLGGILPDFLVRKLGGTPSELRFDHSSPRAAAPRLRPELFQVMVDVLMRNGTPFAPG